MIVGFAAGDPSMILILLLLGSVLIAVPSAVITFVIDSS